MNLMKLFTVACFIDFVMSASGYCVEEFLARFPYEKARKNSC